MFFQDRMCLRKVFHPWAENALVQETKALLEAYMLLRNELPHSFKSSYKKSK